MNESKGRVGFVGAGQMGLPMVRRLTDDGWDVIAFARRARNAIGMRGRRRFCYGRSAGGSS